MNSFPLIKNSFPFPKILFFITLILSLLLSSCGILSDDDSGTLSVNLPPITSQSRSIAGERVDLLKTETRRYRVTVNDVTREGTEVNYTFTLSVGIVAKITVECLNSSGDVIVRAFKEHKVTGGENNVSISLKNDGDEIINTSVTYSYGVAAAGGTVTGFPPSIKVGVGEKFTVTGDSNSITWDYGTFGEWKTNVALKGDADSGTGDVSAGGTVPLGTYIMPSGNVTLTAQWQEMTTLYVGGADASDTTGNGSSAKPFATLQKAFDVAAILTASTQRTIELQSALSATAATMTGGTITLSLNNNTITGTGSASVIRINGGSLTIDGDGTITGGGGAEGGGVYVKSGSFTMNTGTISGNTVTSKGGGVYVASGATFTLSSGGSISSNKADSSSARTYGGGVYNLGTFTMSGGSINDNNVGESATTSSYCYGGGVYNEGTFNMNLGTISDNIAGKANDGKNYPSHSFGGGVHNTGNGCEVNMSGGTISNNKGESGGGVSVYSSASFTMTNGNITNNNSYVGGGVCFDKNTKGDISGGSNSINGNTAGATTVADSGSGLYIRGGSVVTAAAGIVSVSDSIGIADVSADNPATYNGKQYTTAQKIQ